MRNYYHPRWLGGPMSMARNNEILKNITTYGIKINVIKRWKIKMAKIEYFSKLLPINVDLD